MCLLVSIDAIDKYTLTCTHTHTRYTYQLLHLFTSAAAASAFAFFSWRFVAHFVPLQLFPVSPLPSLLLPTLKLILLLFVSFCCCLSCRCQMPWPTLSLSPLLLSHRVYDVLYKANNFVFLKRSDSSPLSIVCVMCRVACSARLKIR